MLIEKYDLEVFTPPCEPGAERYSAKALLPVNISEVLPYLNAVLRGAVYHRQAQALTWKKGGHNADLLQLRLEAGRGTENAGRLPAATRAGTGGPAGGAESIVAWRPGHTEWQHTLSQVGPVLVKAHRLEKAGQQLERLARVNRLGIEGEWEFNEWCHGRTGRPMGYPHQAWSAGMYVFAHHCVGQGHVPLLDHGQSVRSGETPVTVG